jgi:hypothetical protein
VLLRGLSVLASGEGKGVHRGTVEVLAEGRRSLRVCSDQDVTTLTAACIPVGEDVGAGPTSPAPTLHQDGHGGAAPTMNTLGAAVVRLGQ